MKYNIAMLFQGKLMMTCFKFLSFIHPRVLSPSLSLYMNTELFSFTYKTKEANKHFTVWFTIPDWLAILKWKQRFSFLQNLSENRRIQ
jgi:hypothetical protein